MKKAPEQSVDSPGKKRKNVMQASLQKLAHNERVLTKYLSSVGGLQEIAANLARPVYLKVGDEAASRTYLVAEVMEGGQAGIEPISEDISTERAGLSLGEVLKLNAPLTLEQAAQYIQVHPETVRRWIKKNPDFPAHRAEWEYRFFRRELDEWLRRQTAK